MFFGKKKRTAFPMINNTKTYKRAQDDTHSTARHYKAKHCATLQNKARHDITRHNPSPTNTDNAYNTNNAAHSLTQDDNSRPTNTDNAYNATMP